MLFSTACRISLGHAIRPFPMSSICVAEELVVEKGCCIMDGVSKDPVQSNLAKDIKHNRKGSRLDRNLEKQSHGTASAINSMSESPSSIARRKKDRV